MEHSMQVIARIRSDFPTKFGIPRQSGLVEALRAAVVFEPEYRNPDALRGLEGFSHLWLIWEFSELVGHAWSPTVRPPRLGGNTRLGVFATRSPFRPNPIGLSCVRLLGTEKRAADGTVLLVSGGRLPCPAACARAGGTASGTAGRFGARPAAVVSAGCRPRLRHALRRVRHPLHR